MNKKVRSELLPSTEAVEQHLTSIGWTKVTARDPKTANPNVIVYRGGSDIDGKPLTLLLPARPDLKDAEEGVQAAVRLLAALEAKSPTQMAHKIKMQGNGTHAGAVTKPKMRGAASPTRTTATRAVGRRVQAKAVTKPSELS